MGEKQTKTTRRNPIYPNVLDISEYQLRNNLRFILSMLYSLLQKIVIMNKTTVFFGVILSIFSSSCRNVSVQTEILKWKDGKATCVTLTYDDGSDNQFNIAIPIMDELGFKGTFFINTGIIGGTKNYPTFVGRNIMEILKESKNQPTDSLSVLERTSMIRYLCEIQRVPELKEVNMYNIGSRLERGQWESVYILVDEICKVLVKTGKTYNVQPKDPITNARFTWEDLKIYAENGHEFANHTISHPHLSVMDKANILYETEACKSDLESNLGFDHTLTIEAPYGIHDDRVMEILYPSFPFLRNRAPEDYFQEILRNSGTPPGNTGKEYIHWQRGPLSGTPYSQMTSWVDTSLKYNVWLVLVFHGIEGIGWEALSEETIRNYFNHLKSKEQDIWIATYRDAYKYIRERMNSTVKQEVLKGKITVSLNTDLDPTIYNYPLTLKTFVPNNWKKVKLSQGDRTQELKPQVEKEHAFVLYNTRPLDDPVILTKL